jgi:hypothetical protein
MSYKPTERQPWGWFCASFSKNAAGFFFGFFVARKNPIFFPQEEWSPSPSRGDGGAVGRALLAVAGKCLVLTYLGIRVRACGDGAERRLHRACAVQWRRAQEDWAGSTFGFWNGEIALGVSFSRNQTEKKVDNKSSTLFFCQWAKRLLIFIVFIFLFFVSGQTVKKLKVP